MRTIFSQTMEVAMPPSTTISKLSFPQLPEFRGKKIVGIEFHTSDYVPRSPLGNVLVSSADGLRYGYLVLYVARAGEVGEFIQLPLVKLQRQAYNAAAVSSMAHVEFDPVDVDWEKSYLSFPGQIVTAAAGGANTFLFTIHHA